MAEVEPGTETGGLSPTSSKRRISLFEPSKDQSENTNDPESRQAKLKEWEERWGAHKIELPNVLYPTCYAQSVEEEIDLWMTHIQTLVQRAKEQEYLSKHYEVIEGCQLSEEQRTELQFIDANIKEFLKKAEDEMLHTKASKAMIERQINAIKKDIKLLHLLDRK